MNDWQKVETIFNRAMDLEPAARGTYVEDLCEHNDELKQQVMALLAVEQRSEVYLSDLSKKIYPIIQAPVVERINQYRLLDVVGEGGMGVVYKAFDESLQRDVAIKFLSSFQARLQRDKDRFLREAKAAAQLNHPNVCEVFEVGETEDGSLYIVTAFCAGKNLATLLSEQALFEQVLSEQALPGHALSKQVLTLQRIIDIMLQLCGALQSAHTKNIVHRDIKPANVIVDEHGFCKLVDFGIAKLLGSDLSVSGQLVGTFAYMAPEQFSGANVDQRSDIWSLGALLYECLSGRRLYPSNNPSEIMYQIFNGSLPRLTNNTLPALTKFDEVLRRCLSTDKQLRFQSAALLANELNTIRRQLERENKLEFVPHFDSPITSAATAPSSLNEYRKVMALGISIDKRCTGHNHLAQIKRLVKNHLGEVLQKREDFWLVYFGFPKLSEGAADRAFACALSLLKTLGPTNKLASTVKTPIRHVLLHNVPVVMDNAAHNDSGLLVKELHQALIPFLNLQPPPGIVLTEAANRRLKYPLAIATRWRTPNGDDDALYCFNPRDEQTPILTLDAQFNSPMLGRVHELGLLESSWQSVVEGEGRAVMITGEAGMGKSRLLYEFKHQQSLQSSAHQLFECSCDANRQETSLSPLIGGMQALLEKDWGLELSQVESFLNHLALNNDDNALCLAWLIGCQDEKLSHFYLQQSPESLRYQSMALIKTILLRMAQEKNLVIILEDLHWADSTTLEWLDQLLSQTLPSSTLVLLTGRPELFQRWRSYSTIHQLSLNKLSRSNALDLLKSLSAEVNLSEANLDEVLQKTEGNPLFIEEYFKALLEQLSGEAHLPPNSRTHKSTRHNNATDKNATPAIPALALAVPDRLQDILLSRLDRLGGAKAIAQVAAVIGRVFHQGFIPALLPQQQLEIAGNLNRLVEAEILFRKDESYFFFKHALIRDALYETLTVDAKSELHLKLAEQMAANADVRDLASHHTTASASTTSAITAYENIASETIAQHFSLAGKREKSRYWWLQAVKEAEEIFANAEVIKLCKRGMADNQQCKHCADFEAMELQFQMALGKALMSAKGYANDGAGQAHGNAVELARKLNRLEEAYPSMVGLWAFNCVSARHKSAKNLAKEMLDIATQLQSQDLLLEAHMCAGATEMFLGDLTESKRHLDLALSYYQEDMSLRHIRTYGQDPAVVIYSFYPIIQEALGDGAAALKSSDRCLMYARASKHPFSLAFALGFAATIRIRQKQLDYAETLIAENKLLCAQHGIHVFRLLGAIQSGILALAQGKTAVGIQTLNAQIPAYKAMGAEIFVPTWFALLAMSHLQLGEIDQARGCYQQGITQMQNSEEWFNQGILNAVGTQLNALGKSK